MDRFRYGTMGALGLRGLALVVGFALGIAGTAAGKPGPGHHAPSKDNGPWNCEETAQPIGYSYDAGTQYTWYSNGQVVYPWNPGGWQEIQMWADGSLTQFPLEIRDKAGAAYGKGQPAESFEKPRTNGDIDFVDDGKWGACAASYPGNPGTWSLGADFTDTNALMDSATVATAPACPFQRLSYKTYQNGGPVPDSESLGAFDQVWSDIVNGKLIKLGGPDFAHHLTQLYKKAVRNIGGKAWFPQVQ